MIFRAVSNGRYQQLCLWGGLLLCLVGCLKFNLFTNKSDPRILEADSSGDHVVYFGDRDEDGIPISLTGTRVTPQFEDAVDIQVDDLGRPIKFVSASGITSTIDWLSETKFVVSFYSADRAIQVQIPYDTTTNEVGPAATSVRYKGEPPVVERQLSPRGNKKLIARFEPDEPLKVDEKAAAEAAATGNVIVTVTGCDGVPVNDANVEVSYTPRVDPLELGAIDGPAKFIGNGQYSFPVPISGETVGDDVESLCHKLATPLKIGCDGLRFIPPEADPRICATLAATLDAITVPSGEAIAIFAACEAGFSSARLSCEVIGSEIQPTPNPSDIICNNIGDAIDGANFLGTSDIVAIARRGKFTSEPVLVSMPAEGPAPSIQLQIEGEGEIESLTTSPLDPAPHQGYVATAKVRCAPEGTMVNLSVHGSDGYSDEVTVAVTGTGTVQLVVPGAEANVRDDLRASIVGGTGLIIIRSILF